MAAFSSLAFDPQVFETGQNVITSGAVATVAENVAANTLVYLATADVTVTWSLGGADAAAFTINTGGEVRIVASPDFEAQASYAITVQAEDGNGQVSSQPVTVSVTDEDDTAPVITSPGTLSVPENTSPNAIVYSATADEQVAWALSGNDAAAFTIDAAGKLQFVAAPDFETKASYAITLVATDGVGLVGTLALSVTITDVLPVITSPASATATENADASTVIYTATANEPVSWTLAGPDKTAFTIDALGEVRFKASPDFETKTSYAILVVADGDVSKAVAIDIVDVDDTPPVITSADTFTAVENSTGTVYVATADEPVTWTLAGPEAGQFTIHPTSGALSFNVPPDFELKQTYVIDIVATDAAGNTATLTVTGTITNVLEFRVSSPPLVNVFENTSIGQVFYIATAQEAPGPVAWSLAGADAGDFVIDPGTGELLFFESPDYELKTAYALVLEATANGETVTQNLTVAITDVAEAKADPDTTFTATVQNPVAGQYIRWTVQRADGVQRSPATQFLSSETGFTVVMTEPQFTSARGQTEGMVAVATLMKDGVPVIKDGATITDRWAVNRIVSGADGVTQRQIWQRSATQPPRPVGDGIPVGWFDFPVGGTDPLWSSVARQDIDQEILTQWSIPSMAGVFTVLFRWSTDAINWHPEYQEGDIFFQSSADGGETWDEAVRAVGEAGTGTQLAFKLVPDDAPAPQTPTGNGIPAGWSDGPQSGEGDQYMSAAKQLPDGTLRPGESWSVPFRINGRDGISGKDAITAFLSNEAHIVTANSSGTGVDYGGATGTVNVFFGNENASPFFNLSTYSNPQGLTVAYNNSTFAVTSAGTGAGQFGRGEVSNATLTIKAQGGGIFAGVTLFKTFTLQKSRAALDGTPAVGIRLISNRQTVAFDSTGNLAGAQDIVFTTERTGTGSPVAWSMTTVQGVSLSSDNFASTSSSGATVTDDTFRSICAANNTKGIIVTASVLGGAYEDRISVVKVEDGAGGIYDADTSVSTPPTSGGLVSLSNLTTLASCTIDDKGTDGTFKAQWSCTFERTDTTPNTGSTMQLAVEYRPFYTSSWVGALFTNRTVYSGTGPQSIIVTAIFSAPALAGDYDIRLRGHIAGTGNSVSDKTAFAVEWVPAG